MPRFTPTTSDALAELLTRDLRTLDGYRVVGIDGADAARPAEFAGHTAERVRADGRPAETVSLHDYVRPASLRMEFGRDENSYRTGWFDYPALRREVIDPFHSSGTWLPALWDEAADRSARARRRTALPTTVLFVAGPMLLGRGLPFDRTVRLDLSTAALTRNTPDAQAWTLPGLLAHDREHRENPSYFVRWDHPGRPALRVGRY
ncbi:nucleoside/nucleotide kinase family protein [Nocardia sp. X0981]